jgi:hypothetical protein
MDKEDIPKLLGLLDVKRCNEFKEWIRVGNCLYNIENTDAHLKLWKRFTQKGEKFKAEDCEKYWAKMTQKEDGIKLGSLIFWAKADNEAEFTKYRAGKDKKDKKGKKMKVV